MGAKQALYATAPCPWTCSFGDGVWLRAIETEISAALWALVARGGL